MKLACSAEYLVTAPPSVNHPRGHSKTADDNDMTNAARTGGSLPHSATDSKNTPAATAMLSSSALAIIESCHNRQQIRSCNLCARKAGIYTGMALNSAYAILPALTVVEHDPAHEATLLRQIGEWTMQYSSIVSLQPPCHVLLEIGASKQLFDNFKALVGQIQQGLQTLGVTAGVGVAPTPLAANVLARANQRLGTASLARLPSLLGQLPIAHLELDNTTLEGLQRSGIREIHALLDIPAASLTRRFGPQCPLYLAQLLGRHPDPREPIRLGDFFKRSHELALEVEDISALQFITQRMIGELSAFLTTRDCGVNSFEVTLCHRKAPDTHLQLRFLQATSQARHLHRVLSERLAKTVLPEPVLALHLLADTFSQIERDANDLFIKSRGQQKTLGEITDKLCSRLGADAVYTLSSVDDHRPEKAWCKSPPEAPIANTLFASQTTQPSLPCNWPERPLWLLAKPEPTNQPLFFEAEIERIECGWWECNDVRRDYFVARNQYGTRYWVFRTRTANQTQHWFIHGIFS